MPEKLTTRLLNNLRDSFQSDWKLLSETEHFLASTPLQQNYEQQFAVWRKRLQTGKNDAVRASVREDLIALRKALRLEGYDLSLGAIQLIVKDFVNDDAAARGRRRSFRRSRQRARAGRTAQRGRRSASCALSLTSKFQRSYQIPHMLNALALQIRIESFGCLNDGTRIREVLRADLDGARTD